MPKKSEHPNVKLKPPRLGCTARCAKCDKCKSDARARQPYWAARWVDPDDKLQRLTSLKLDDSELRRFAQVLDSDRSRARAAKAWAVQKSKDIAKRIEEIASGASTATGMNIDVGIDLFFASKKDWSDRTLKEFASPFGHFKRWAERTKTTYDSLTRSKIDDFRSYLFDVPAQRLRKGGKRGETTSLGKPRGALTVNGDLVSVGSLLRYLREKSMLPKATMEDIKWGLRKYKVDDTKPKFMWPPKIKEVIAAADDHDADTFTMTRDDKRELGQRREKSVGEPWYRSGASEKGSTPRNKPVRAYLYGALMTGMRHDELSLVTFETHVNLNATYWHEVPIAQIALRAEDVKTGKPRNVLFDVSPMLQRMIVALNTINGGKGLVFGLTYDEASDAMERLRDLYGAPADFTWQLCRSTCDTYLCNSKGIYHAAATQLASAQLGHSVDVAQKFYVGLIPGGIPEHIKTLELAMEIEEPFRKYVEELEAQAREIERSTNVISMRERRRAPKHGGGRRKATSSARKET